MPAYYVPISIGTDLLLLAIFTGLSLRFVRFNTLRPPLQLLGACGFGLLLFSYLLFALGQFSLLKTPVFLSVLVLLACFAYRPVRDLLPSSTYRLTLPDFQSIEKVLLALILLVALFNFLFGFAPPTGDDELAYHISLPVLYIKMGTMVNVPTLLQSYFYLNGELLYTGVLLLRDIFAVKAMVWLSGLLVVWALYYFAREHLRFERKYALLAVALAYTCPMMTSLHGTTSSDLFNLFLTLVSANLYWEWRQTKSRKLLVLMAVLGGAAIGFRNYAVNWVIPMMAVILLLDRRPLDAFLFGFIAVCVFSPWPIRDFILTGNPFYPSAYWASAATDPYHLAMRPEFTPKTFLKSLAILIHRFKLSRFYPICG